MTGTLATIVIALLAGWPLTRIAGGVSGRGARAGLALLLGCGAVSLVLYALSGLGIAWSRTSILAGVALLAAVAWGIPRPPEASPRPPARQPLAIPFLAVVAVLVAGHAVYATTGPRTESDFLEIWGLKGRVFYEARGIEWSFLANETTFHNHADYPPLLPLLFASAAVLRGRWEDPELGLFFTAFGAALLLIAEGWLRRRHGGSWLTALAVLAVTPLGLSPWIGIGEGPLLAYGSAALLLTADGLEERARRTMLTAGVLLGFAALTKNEGIAMIVAAALAVVLSSRSQRSQVIRLWPAVAMTALWVVPSAVAGLATDLAAGNPAARLVDRLRDPRPILELMAAHSAWRPIFWAGLAVGIVATLGRRLFAERVALVFVLAQVALYVTAYAVTPHDLAWHVRWSWERLLSHVAFLLTVAILSAVVGTLRDSSFVDRPSLIVDDEPRLPINDRR